MKKQKQGLGVEHKGPDLSLDDSSVKTDAAIKDPLHESPALLNLSSSKRLTKNSKRKKTKTEHNVAKSNANGCGTPEKTSPSKPSTLALDIPPEHTIQRVSTDAVMRRSCVEKDQNMLIKAAETSDDLGQGVEHKCPYFSLDDSSVMRDAAIKDPLHESPALPDLLSSERLVEHKTKKSRKRKNTKTEHNVAESNVNGCGTAENTSPSKSSAPALGIPPEHTIHCVSTDAVTRQSCVEKDQNMLIKAAENSDDLGQGVEHKSPDFSVDDSSVKTDSAIKDSLHESPALPDLLSSERPIERSTKKNKKRKKTKTEHNVTESNVNGCGTPENTSPSKSSTPALGISPEHTIQCVSTDAVMRQSCVEKDQNMLIKAAETSDCLGQGIQHKGPDFLLDDSSVKTNAATKDPAHESSALPDLSSSETLVEPKTKKNKKRKKTKTEHNAAKNNVNGCGTPENTSPSKDSTPAMDMPPEHKIQCGSTDAVMRQSTVEADICLGENKEREQNMLIKAAETSDCLGHGVEHKGPDFSLDDSSVKTNAAIKDPVHQSPALPDLSSSETLVEPKTKKNKKRKKTKTEHNAAKNNVNGCGTPENTSPSKDSTPAMDMPPEHKIQCGSTDAVMRQSTVEADICLGGNEEKEQHTLIKAAKKRNEECDIQDEDYNCNSVVANAELLAKESVLKVVTMNMEQSINDNSSNPEEKNGSVKYGSPSEKHDDYLAVDDFSDKLQWVKTYTRRKVLNTDYRRDSDCPSAVNGNKEPIMQDHHKDDSHKFSDGPSTEGSMEKETDHSGDQVTSHSEVATEEMDSMTEDTSEQRFMVTSSVVDIPVMQLEETSARQLGHAEITKNDLCCPGDVSDSSLVTINDGNSKILQFSPDRTIISNSKNKLLILDVNGLLADCVSFVPGGYHQPEPDFWLRRRKVYKRPFCDGFLQFCFDRFHVGVWSSRAKCNVDEVIKFLMGESASKLLFCWNQSHCTTTKFSTVENRDKPLVLKELRKIWEKVDPSLPWEKGEFNESNTLLLDDSPYKALVNPMYTAIFPYSYRYYHTKDSSLGPGGDLRVYLEGLAMADNVKDYVSSNPFGQRPIREANPSWGYYCKVIEAVKAQRKR